MIGRVEECILFNVNKCHEKLLTKWKYESKRVGEEFECRERGYV